MSCWCKCPKLYTTSYPQAVARKTMLSHRYDWTTE